MTPLNVATVPGLSPKRDNHHWLAIVTHVSSPPMTSNGVKAGALHLNGFFNSSLYVQYSVARMLTLRAD